MTTITRSVPHREPEPPIAPARHADREEAEESVPPRRPRRTSEGSGSASERVALRLHPDVKQRVEYWAGRHNMSANEYMANAVEDAIRRENQDYDLPTLEIARLNQLVDEISALARNSANLERVVTAGFDSLIGLTRGDNYLLDDEEGEI